MLGARQTWNDESNLAIDASKSAYSKPATFWLLFMESFTPSEAPSMGLPQTQLQHQSQPTNGSDATRSRSQPVPVPAHGIVL